MAKTSQKKKKTLIKDSRSKHVTFSKRRSGIFNKASELCTLCAVEMAVIIFSPGGKPYSFCHPSPDAIFKRLTDSANSNAHASGEGRSQQEAVWGELDKQYCDLHAQLNVEKKRGKELKRRMNFPDIDKMNRDQLLKLKASLEYLRVKVLDRKEELLTVKPVDLSLTLGGVYSAGDASSSSAKYHQTGQNFLANAHKGDFSSSRFFVPKSQVMFKGLEIQ